MCVLNRLSPYFNTKCYNTSLKFMNNERLLNF